MNTNIKYYRWKKKRKVEDRKKEKKEGRKEGRKKEDEKDLKSLHGYMHVSFSVMHIQEARTSCIAHLPASRGSSLSLHHLFSTCLTACLPAHLVPCDASLSIEKERRQVQQKGPFLPSFLPSFASCHLPYLASGLQRKG